MIDNAVWLYSINYPIVLLFAESPRPPTLFSSRSFILPITEFCLANTSKEIESSFSAGAPLLDLPLLIASLSVTSQCLWG